MITLFQKHRSSLTSFSFCFNESVEIHKRGVLFYGLILPFSNISCIAVHFTKRSYLEKEGLNQLAIFFTFAPRLTVRSSLLCDSNVYKALNSNRIYSYLKPSWFSQRSPKSTKLTLHSSSSFMIKLSLELLSKALLKSRPMTFVDSATSECLLPLHRGLPPFSFSLLSFYTLLDSLL